MIPVGQVRRLLGEPLRAAAWELFMPSPPAPIVPLAANFTMRARGAVIPGVNNESFKTRFGPLEFVHPGRKNYSKKALFRFEEGVWWPIQPALYLWNNLVLDETSGVGAPSGMLVCDLWVRMLTKDQVKQAYHFYNVFPETVPDVNVRSDSNELVHFDVTFAYNWWRWELWPF